jgi:hypothetical protein
VRLSDAERDGEAAPETVERARALFLEWGAVVIDNLFPRPLVERLGQVYSQRYGSLEFDHLDGKQYLTGLGRLIHPLRIAAPFDEPMLYGNPFVLGLLRALMPEEAAVLNSCSVVVAQPGAPRQAPHRDAFHLFGYTEPSISIPTFAVTLGVPLVDLTEETGTTAMYRGTHRMLCTTSEVKAKDASHPHIECGGAYLMDYRLIHGGTPNRGARARPIIYLVYARPWWIDAGNYLDCNIPSLVIDEETLGRVPAHLQALLVRARVPLFARTGFP